MRKMGLAAVAAMVLAGGVRADVPDVAVDIPPVHSLVARVMQGLGDPALIVRPGASPHGYAMRPSEAAALERADVVFYVSGNLTGWFEHALEPLAAQARVVELLETDGTLRLEFRETALFGGDGEGDMHEHDEHADEEHEDGHGHEEPEAHADEHEHDDEHAHDDDHGHEEEHAHEEADEHGHDHDHEGADPHAWLDPENAKVWIVHIAETLAEADPQNAAAYRENAAKGQAEIDAAVVQARALIDPVKGVPFFVQHDAYQYLENRFGLRAAGAIARGDAAQPGPRRIAELRTAAAELGVACVFSEPQFNQALLKTVFAGDAVRVAALDPLGTTLELGPGLYPALISDIAEDVAACLGGE